MATSNSILTTAWVQLVPAGDLDPDMLGFAVSLAGMIACVMGAGIWSLIA